ncbi:MAG: hypothetical protein FWH52_00175 [Synergistaceae bacterium]|nr:hypothetical protein [Synergistaceae bacterium]
MVTKTIKYSLALPVRENRPVFVIVYGNAHSKARAANSYYFNCGLKTGNLNPRIKEAV